MSVIHTPRKNILDERQAMVPAMLALAIVFFLVRLWYIQVVRSESLAAMGVSTGIDEVMRIAPRGRIVDRNGALLAGVKQNAVVTAVYDVVKDHPESIVEVSRLLGVDPSFFERALKEASWDPYTPSPIYIGAPPEAASYIAEAGERLPGISLELQPTRFYAEPLSLSHVLGYVWKPSEREVKRLKEAGVEPMKFVGRDALESRYEKDLMGVAGTEILAVDPQMRPLRTIRVENPVPGDELVLAIDLRLQRVAMEVLRGRRGAVVATDPRTGEVLCLASSPSYDIHMFDNGISQEKYALLMADVAKPLLKRAISGAYPPGSTFKIVTSIAAQLGGIFDPERPALCRGYFMLGKRRVGCLGTHGSISFHEAMTRSCNAYFSDLAHRAGGENMRLACEKIGLAGKQGIDISGESPGIVPTAEWVEEKKLTWNPGDTVNMGIGQGYLALTPLQMNSVISVVANRGKVYSPHLVMRRVDDAEKSHAVKPILRSDLQLPDSFWDTLQAALVNVVAAGTARSAFIEGLSWGGKTGSAQHRLASQTHGWFVGYAPAEDPRIAITVIVEAAGHGGSVAAPIAKEVVKRYLFGNLSPIPQVQSSAKPLASERTPSTPAESPFDE